MTERLPPSLAIPLPPMRQQLVDALEQIHRAIEECDDALAILCSTPINRLAPQKEQEEVRRKLRASRQRLFNITQAVRV
jgi:hypothetical protein